MIPGGGGRVFRGKSGWVGFGPRKSYPRGETFRESVQSIPYAAQKQTWPNSLGSKWIWPSQTAKSTCSWVEVDLAKSPWLQAHSVNPNWPKSTCVRRCTAAAPSRWSCTPPSPASSGTRSASQVPPGPPSPTPSVRRSCPATAPAIRSFSHWPTLVVTGSDGLVFREEKSALLIFWKNESTPSPRGRERIVRPPPCGHSRFWCVGAEERGCPLPQLCHGVRLHFELDFFLHSSTAMRCIPPPPHLPLFPLGQTEA